MGYACPVCGDPQADAGHLANHLAITAIARGGDHESWLDEHVPDWDERGEDALAEAVSEVATETDYPQVFEDTTGAGRDDHEHTEADLGQGTHQSHHGYHQSEGADGGPRAPAVTPQDDLPVDVADPRRATGHTDGEVDAATREAIRRARAMTAEADSSDEADEGDGVGEGDGGNEDDVGNEGDEGAAGSDAGTETGTGAQPVARDDPSESETE